MNAILDVVAGLRELLEPGDTVTKDETGAPPLEHKPEVLYAYADPVRLLETPIDTGPTIRQDFTVVAEFMESSSENALQRRDVEVSEPLDDRLGRWLAAVRTNQVTAIWMHIRAAARPAPRKMTGRGIAIAISGYRLLA